MFVASGKKRKFAPTSQNAAERAFVRRAQGNDTHGLASVGSTAGASDTIKRYYILGQENARERQYRAALDCYNRAIAVSMNEAIAKEAKLYVARAHVLYKLREFTRAMDDAKEAIAIDGNSAAGYTQMAGILAATGKRRDALAVLEGGFYTVDRGAAGYAHMETLRATIARQLDPSAVMDLRAKTTDPMVHLPSDLLILVLRNLDIRTLVVCRAVSRRWLALLDNTPVLWSYPLFAPTSAVTRLAQQLPAYQKLQKWIKKNNTCGRIPDRILRFVFQKARGSLVSATVPSNSLVSGKTLDALLAQKRPCLRQIDISRVAEVGPDMVGRMLNGWCVPNNIVALRLPYCTSVDNSAISTIVRHAPRIRTLDISGCHSVRVKHMFKAWSSVLLDSHDSAAIENLYMNDHPGIPDLLVYSTRYCHFAKLKSLHIAIYDQRVLSMFSSIAPLVDYLRRSQAHRTQQSSAPFPQLEELNVDGIWDIPVSSLRFGSNVLCNLVFQCKIFAKGLRRLSAVESPGIDRNQLGEALWSCLPTLQRLHLTRATNIDTQLLVDIASNRRDVLPLESLDLSGCAGIASQGLYALISCCSNLVYVNLGGTAVDNMVMGLFTQMISTLSSPGLEVLALDTTDITGVAVRDFAAACIKRYRSIRSDPHARQVWKLRILDIDNCSNVGSDAVTVVRELLSPIGTQILAAVPA
ncbi:hypothetical protein LPJ81_002070 [Coemansia sp. IMI 209127]|nr:hypothetical protein LPJ81_002070 [Coemansia sp. IMI 209127]